MSSLNGAGWLAAAVTTAVTSAVAKPCREGGRGGAAGRERWRYRCPRSAARPPGRLTGHRSGGGHAFAVVMIGAAGPDARSPRGGGWPLGRPVARLGQASDDHTEI